MQNFRKLVDQHQKRVYGFAYYFMGNREDAEEITQDVLLNLWRHWQRVKPESMTAWVTRVTRNACIDALRKRQNYQERVMPENEERPLSETVAGEDDPAKQVEISDFQRQVKEALQQLSEPYRTIVILREIQDMAYDEIRATTDLPMNTVKAYLHRGRKMLRDQLRETMNNDQF